MNSYIPTMSKEELLNYRKIILDDIARLESNRNKSFGDGIVANISIPNNEEELKEIDARLATL